MFVFVLKPFRFVVEMMIIIIMKEIRPYAYPYSQRPSLREGISSSTL